MNANCLACKARKNEEKISDPDVVTLVTLAVVCSLDLGVSEVIANLCFEHRGTYEMCLRHLRSRHL